MGWGSGQTVAGAGSGRFRSQSCNTRALDRESGRPTPSLEPTTPIDTSTFRDLLGRLRRVAAAARNGLDRRLHPRRHRRALEAVRGPDAIREIVFLCLGNICRSPYAEVRLRRHLEEAGLAERITVRSAGFLGPGRPSPEAARLVTAERGLSLEEHRSQVLIREHLRRSDLLFVMTNRQQRDLRWGYGRPDTLHLGDLDPGPIPRRDILDPIEQPVAVFREVYDRIDRAVEALARELIAGGPTGDRRDERPADRGADRGMEGADS